MVFDRSMIFLLRYMTDSIFRFTCWEKLLASRVSIRHSLGTGNHVHSVQWVGGKQTTRLPMDLFQHWTLDSDNLHLLAHHRRPLAGSCAEPAPTARERILHSGSARTLDWVHLDWPRSGTSAPELGQAPWVRTALERCSLQSASALTAVRSGWRPKLLDEIAD